MKLAHALSRLAVLLAALSSVALCRGEETCPTDGCGQTFGTSIHWAEDVGDASRRAQREGKLLLLMHLSGNFAKSAFT